MYLAVQLLYLHVLCTHTPLHKIHPNTPLRNSAPPLGPHKGKLQTIIMATETLPSRGMLLPARYFELFYCFK